MASTRRKQLRRGEKGIPFGDKYEIAAEERNWILRTWQGERYESRYFMSLGELAWRLMDLEAKKVLQAASSIEEVGHTFACRITEFEEDIRVELATRAKKAA
jgi:hypothetical protein